MTPQLQLRLLCALVLLCLHAICASSLSAGPSAPRAPYDPRDFTMALSNEDRAYRAANTPGGEVSFCCCYCGRGGVEANGKSESTADLQQQQQQQQSLSEEDAAAAAQRQAELDEDAQAAGIASEDAWLYASLPSQPRPESGDPTDRLAQRRRRRQREQQRARARERQQRGHRRIGSPKGRTHSGLDPSADGAEAYNRNNSSLPADSASSLASFSIYPSLESGCDNEGCAESSSLCRTSHLWTGWAGDFGLATSSTEAVRSKCQAIYQREMEVLNEFNKIMEREMTPASPAANPAMINAP